jgi:hypothetical protein
MRISYENKIDTLVASTFTVLSEDTGYPGTNLQEQRLSQVWRSTTASAQTITINLGSALSINTAALISHNLTSSATVTISANTSNSWGSPATTKTIVYNTNIMLNFFNSISYQYWQFSIIDTTNTSGYIQLGRLWLGSYITIDPSSLLDFTVTKKRSDNVYHNLHRQKFVYKGVGWRSFELNYPSTSEATINLINDMYDFSGNHSSIIFCNFDSIRTYELVEPCYCSINGNIKFSHKESMKWEYSLSLEEEL